jgi:hypothetical protein
VHRYLHAAQDGIGLRSFHEDDDVLLVRTLFPRRLEDSARVEAMSTTETLFSELKYLDSVSIVDDCYRQ